jgi:hypothetical protein
LLFIVKILLLIIITIITIPSGHVAWPFFAWSAPCCGLHPMQKCWRLQMWIQGLLGPSIGCSRIGWLWLLLSWKELLLLLLLLCLMQG